ncbi:MAG: response regulator transcription factor [Solirubrobacterales bacterium]|nr:response regulator transcription factor [Solirubrobacterales bacterium]
MSASLRLLRQPPTGGDDRLRVVIADHDGLARRMMRTGLSDEGVVVVAAAREAPEALDLTRFYQPEVLIIDTALPPAGGLEVIPQVRSASPGTRILTVSAGEDNETALSALRTGAIGHVSKDLHPRSLAQLIVRAAEGEAIVPRRLVMPLLDVVRDVPDSGWRPLRSRLTTREWEIVELLDEGVSTDDIAERLVLSTTTIYSHIKSIMRKLNVHSRRDAVHGARLLRRKEVRENSQASRR